MQSWGECRFAPQGESKVCDGVQIRGFQAAKVCDEAVPTKGFVLS